MVIPVGFEPNIAGLRVRPPKPLEDGTIRVALSKAYYTSFPNLYTAFQSICSSGRGWILVSLSLRVSTRLNWITKSGFLIKDFAIITWFRRGVEVSGGEQSRFTTSIILNYYFGHEQLFYKTALRRVVADIYWLLATQFVLFPLWYLLWDSNSQHLDFESSVSANWTKEAYGDSDGARTRDLLRDRQAF